jgi:hypothetical protein
MGRALPSATTLLGATRHGIMVNCMGYMRPARRITDYCFICVGRSAKGFQVLRRQWLVLVLLRAAGPCQDRKCDVSLLYLSMLTQNKETLARDLETLVLGILY